MNDTYKIASRYGVERVLMTHGTDVYRISGKSLYHRCGYKSDGSGIEFVDFEGGPFIQLNDIISFFGAENDERRITQITIDETSGEGMLRVLLRVS